MSQEPAGSDASAEAIARELKAAQEKAAKAEARAAELQAEIDDAVKRRKAEAEKAKVEAEKRGEFEKVIESLKTELDVAKAEAEAGRVAIAENAEIKTRLAEYDDRERAALLGRIPEDLRESYKEKSLEVLRDVVGVLKEEPPAPVVDKGRNPQYRVSDLDSLPWSQMTIEQRAKWAEGKTPAQVAAKLKSG
jgi:Zn-dependent M32 family carboxypeptidase